METSAGVETTHFARLRPGETVADASWVLRRVVSAAGSVDELLGRDGVWRPSDMLARTERGELPGTLKRMSHRLPAATAKTLRSHYGAIRRALDRQQAGDFLLRLARPGTGTAFGALDAEAQAEVVAFLTQAPLVAPGFRTDGMWVWPESIAQEVLATGAHPENLFYRHIRSRHFFLPEMPAPSVIERARRLLEIAATTDGTAQETNVPGQPPPPTQEERLRAVGSWHAEWERKHAATTPFRPERHAPDSGYNLHHVDVDASPEADWEYIRRSREIMGLDPETGLNMEI